MARLKVPFSCHTPNIDETPRPNEMPAETALRLAREKAAALSQSHPNHLIIGSDQIACHDNSLINKPGTHDAAVAQLLNFSGQTVEFLSAVCVHNSLLDSYSCAVIATEVHFRNLSNTEIDQYLLAEQPYDCAGSVKAEGLGIALFDKISSDDPTAIIGLPMIKLCRMLLEQGYNIFDNID